MKILSKNKMDFHKQKNIRNIHTLLKSVIVHIHINFLL